MIQCSRRQTESFSSSHDREKLFGSAWGGTMIRVAIVEDDSMYQEKISGFIRKYEAESGERFEISQFYDGYDIIDKYKMGYDMIFMDIQMKTMNGMAAAKKIRRIDQNVILIFITNMSQYATQGYEVEALNYILKPVTYFAFSQELAKAVKRLKRKSSSFITVMQNKGVLRLDVSRISYLESEGHQITVHTDDGVYSFRGTMKEMEEKLADKGFARCNSGYLVNLRYVEEIRQNFVTVAGEELQISRPRKKSFMETLTDYLGGK